MRRILGLAAAIALCAPAWGDERYLPDPKLTPGALNADVTQDNIHETVCVAGWADKLQPPASYLEQVKAEQLKAMQLQGEARDYHEDHLIPLCLGGHPTDPRNLWPQRVAGDWNYKVKDQLEVQVCKAVCRGQITLSDGQWVFREPDWTRQFLKWHQF